MSKPVEVKDATFQSEVLESDKPVLVDFWAEWCGPCRMIAPVLDEIASEKSDSLKIAKVNVDENGISAQQNGVTSIPTMVLFKNGQPVERIVGAQPKERLLDTLNPHLG
jgi:thioredoxin 1